MKNWMKNWKIKNIYLPYRDTGAGFMMSLMIEKEIWLKFSGVDHAYMAIFGTESDSHRVIRVPNGTFNVAGKLVTLGWIKRNYHFGRIWRRTSWFDGQNRPKKGLTPQQGSIWPLGPYPCAFRRSIDRLFESHPRFWWWYQPNLNIKYS